MDPQGEGAVRRKRVEAEADRLESLGLDHYAVAMADPEGNEFDVH